MRFFQILFVLIPWWYICFRKGKNKIIFTVAVVGIVTIIQSVFATVSGVVIHAVEFVFPELFAGGAPEVLLPVLYLMDFYRENWLLISVIGTIVGYIVAQIYLLRKCEVFRG